MGVGGLGLGGAGARPPAARQLAFDTLAVSYVPAGQQDVGAPAVVVVFGHESCLEPAAPGEGRNHVLDHGDLVAAEDAASVALDPIGVLGRVAEGSDSLSDHLGGGCAGDLLDGGARQGDAEIAVDAHDDVGRALQDAT